MYTLEGRVMVVTGAAGEIGFQVARLAVQAGATLVLTDVNMVRLEERAATLCRGAEPLLCRQDVTDEADALAVAEQCRTRYGRVDLVVCGAGLYERLPLAQLDTAGWRRTIAVNLDGVFHTIHALRHLLSDGSAIVNIASHAGHQGSGEHSAYAAAKGGVLGLTRSLAKELAPRTRVNAVSPGLVDTEMLRAMKGGRREAMIASTPMGRMASAEEIAHAVLFLCAEEAGFFNGAALHANGGLYMAG